MRRNFDMIRWINNSKNVALVLNASDYGSRFWFFCTCVCVKFYDLPSIENFLLIHIKFERTQQLQLQLVTLTSILTYTLCMKIMGKAMASDTLYSIVSGTHEIVNCVVMPKIQTVHTFETVEDWRRTHSSWADCFAFGFSTSISTLVLAASLILDSRCSARRCLWFQLP